MSVEQPNSSSKTGEHPMRSLDSLRPDEYEKYLEIPGWRIWQWTIFDSDERRQALKTVEALPFTLKVNIDRKGYQQVWDKYQEITGVKVFSLLRGTGTFDRPSFILEPLSKGEISDLAEESRLNEILSPSELKVLLSE